MPDASAPLNRSNENADSPPLTRSFVLRVIFILSAIAVAFAVFKLSSLLLLGAGAIVVAVIIHMLADPIHKRLKIKKKLSVILSILIIGILLGATGWLFGSQLAAQANTLVDELPRSIGQVRDSLAGTPFGDLILQGISQMSEQAGAALGYLRGLVGGILNSMVAIIVVIVSGIVLSTQPVTYRDGLLLLVPKPRRGRLRAVMNACGRSLKGWLLGQLIAMSVIAVLVSLGLLLVGVPSWLILGLLAGFAQFVPLVGPIASAIPGLIIAASMGVSPFLWTLVVYVGVQQIESNFLTPYVMNRTAALPMVLTLFSILAFTALFGVVGAVFATPITVILYVGVQMLYVEDQLGEKLQVKGERAHIAPEGV